MEPILLTNPTRLLRRASRIATSTSPYVVNIATVAAELLLEGDCYTQMGDRYIHSAVEADCTTHERNIQPAFQHDQATAERYTVAKPNCDDSQGQALRHHR